jgi:ribosomal protein S18 acetylase RimI-like enzyme
MVGELERQHDRLIGVPHRRLEFLAVDPGRQGSGIGSALADHGHAIADELGLPCYLETFTESNVRFYERRGYRIIDEFPVGAGVAVYAMLRPARRPLSPLPTGTG